MECFDNLIGNRVRDMFEETEKRNHLVSIISGILFFGGWWIVIDVGARYASTDFNGAYYICGILGSLSFLMVNMISAHQIEMYQYGIGGYGVYIWLFIGFVLGFGSLIASIWILIGAYIIPGHNIWPGLGLFAQNLFIYLGSMAFKFGRRDDSV